MCGQTEFETLQSKLLVALKIPRGEKKNVKFCLLGALWWTLRFPFCHAVFSKKYFDRYSYRKVSLRVLFDYYFDYGHFVELCGRSKPCHFLVRSWAYSPPWRNEHVLVSVRLKYQFRFESFKFSLVRVWQYKVSYSASTPKWLNIPVNKTSASVPSPFESETNLIFAASNSFWLMLLENGLRSSLLHTQYVYFWL